MYLRQICNQDIRELFIINYEEKKLLFYSIASNFI